MHTVDDAADGEAHDADEAGREDRLLHAVEQREARRGLERGRLVLGERAVEPLGLVRLGLEVLDRLVVEQRVHRLRVRLLVRAVHLQPELRAAAECTVLHFECETYSES